jgi:hypothetical protein
VWLRTSAGAWLEVRGDAKMPGTVLLRDQEGYVYFITYPGVQQVGGGLACPPPHSPRAAVHGGAAASGPAASPPASQCHHPALGLGPRSQLLPLPLPPSKQPPPPTPCPSPSCPHQIDLTDDQVVIAVFGDRRWEQQCQRVTAKDDNGQLTDVQMDQDVFREIISLLD